VSRRGAPASVLLRLSQPSLGAQRKARFYEAEREGSLPLSHRILGLRDREHLNAAQISRRLRVPISLVWRALAVRQP
jgi:hypothetical protein